MAAIGLWSLILMSTPTFWQNARGSGDNAYSLVVSWTQNPIRVSHTIVLMQTGSKMRYLTTLIFAVCFGSLSACASSDFKSDIFPRDYENLEISLDRSWCMGGCPSYVVKVTGDGNVSYCGFTNVEEKERRTRQINPDNVRSLYDQILAAGFFNLRDEYFSNYTDGVSYKVSVSVDNQTKAVRDFFGREAGMPESVTAIQDAID